MYGELEMKRNKELEGAHGNVTGAEDRTLRWHFHGSHGPLEGERMKGTTSDTFWLADGWNVNLITALQVWFRLFQAPSGCSGLVNIRSLIPYIPHNAGVLCCSQLLANVTWSLKGQGFIHLFLLLLENIKHHRLTCQSIMVDAYRSVYQWSYRCYY